MAIPKIKGIETEWSVVVCGKDYYRPAETAEFNLMINAIRKYLKLPLASKSSLIREIENIGRISKSDKNAISESDNDSLWLSYASSGLSDKKEETSKKDKDNINPRFHHNLLSNGSRFYVDAAHIEYSTPECLSTRTLVAADKAGEAILNLARISIEKALAEHGLKMIIYKDTSDRQGTSYGCHENYLVSREIFNKITDFSPSHEAGLLISYLIARQIFTGAGKIGIELDGRRTSESIYQISQRADFIKEAISHCTTHKRAIINLRDEPHADAKRFARLHIIVGDANMSEFATYLKLGITSIILKMLEDGFLEGDLIIKDPVSAIKLVSRDLTCKEPVLETSEGRKLSSLNLNEEFFERAQRYFSQVCEPSVEEQDLLQKWGEVINDFLTGNEERLRRRLDWKIKQSILDNFLKVHNIDWKDIEGAVIQDGSGASYRVINQLFKKDLLYHDINKEEGLYLARKEIGEAEEIVTKEEIISLVKSPPEDCRSYFRGKCLEKFYSQIDFVDWEEIVFSQRNKKGYKNFRISSSPSGIEIGNPVWGSKEDVGEILEKANNFGDLIEELQKLENN